MAQGFWWHHLKGKLRNQLPFFVRLNLKFRPSVSLDIQQLGLLGLIGRCRLAVVGCWIYMGFLIAVCCGQILAGEHNS